jgi:hypothetical protein
MARANEQQQLKQKHEKKQQKQKRKQEQPQNGGSETGALAVDGVEARIPQPLRSLHTCSLHTCSHT